MYRSFSFYVFHFFTQAQTVVPQRGELAEKLLSVLKKQKCLKNVNDGTAIRHDEYVSVELTDYIEEEIVEEVIEEAPIPFALVEEKPSFNGGDANEFSRWVNSQLVYPEIAKENFIQGKVILQFTVTAYGQVTNVMVLRGVDPLLDNEAVRIVKSSPAWKPGKQRDRAVPVNLTIPVIFRLR